MKKAQPNRTWVEVDYKAIERNTKTLKKLLGEKIAMMAVVKSNAYGHGTIESARAAVRGGATWIGVDEITEALELRLGGIKTPILVLGYTLPFFYKIAAEKKISITISSLESLQGLVRIKQAKKLRIHIEFETGLHRQGISETHTQQVVRLISSKNFSAVIEGAYTHFSVMEDPMRQEYSKMQTRAFKNILAKLNQKGFTPITHASASSGILFSKDFYFDMCRAGIAIYGLWPSPEIRKWAQIGPTDGAGTILAPALSWKSIISEVKLVNKGAKIGYDMTYEVVRNSRIAIIPVGYWHGLPRNLSNKGQVLICGKRANIIGRISMDMTIIDVTDIPSVKQGDIVTIIGHGLPAEEIAQMAGTINYELVTRINPLIPRISAKFAVFGTSC